MSSHPASTRTFARAPALALVCCLAAPLLLAAAGCGKKGPPLPPIRRAPARVAKMSLRQVGDRILVSFPRPASRTDETPLGPDAEIEIAMTAREPVPKRAGDVVAHPAAVWSIPAPEWDAYGAGRLDIGLSLDRLRGALEMPAEAPGLAGRSLSFVVVVTEPKNRRSDPSDVATFVVCEPPPAPLDTSATIVQEGVLLRWKAAGAENAKFNVYRQDRGAPTPDRPLAPKPLDAGRFLDADAVQGKPYRYFVRAVGGTAGCESPDGAIVPATRVDLFPPTPPQGLAAVTEQGVIRLFWRPNREPDLGGYRVYRADGPDAPWRLLTPGDITTTSFTDSGAAPGVRYSYAVTARDLATPPNESNFSVPTIEALEKRD